MKGKLILSYPTEGGTSYRLVEATGTDHYFTSGFMAYEYSACDFETVPPFETCLLPVKLFMNDHT